MKLETFDMLRVWAALTGLILAIGFFAMLYLGMTPWQQMPLLVAGIGGFELFLFAQDIMRRRRQNG